MIISNRIWIVSALLFLLLFNGYCDDVVANYRRDFRGETPLTPGWRYLWNAPEGWEAGKMPFSMWAGRIGDSSSYRPLISATGIWTADGDRKGNNGTPDRFVTLDPTGGHPGGGTEVYRNYEGRFAIAAYTVSESGHYALSNTDVSVGTSDVGDGIELVVHINDNKPLLKKHIPAGEKVTFDLSLGELKAGDSVYVGGGPWLKSYADAFQWNFSITQAQ